MSGGVDLFSGLSLPVDARGKPADWLVPLLDLGGG